MAVSTSYILNGGTFDATGPNGNVHVGFEFNVDGSVNVALEPLDFLTGWANIDIPLPNPDINETIFDLDTHNLSFTWPLPVPGVDVTLSYPNIVINSSSLEDQDSEHILFLNADLDAAASYYFPPALALSDPIPGTDVDPQLVDIDIFGFVDLVQKLKVNLDSLSGTLKLEDGTSQSFHFGDTLPFITNASSHAGDDGALQYSVDIDPNVTLHSTAGIDFGVGASVVLFRDLPADLDPITLFNESLPLVDFNFFDEPFTLAGFNQQSWNLIA
jgi:hypothetical protein